MSDQSGLNERGNRQGEFTQGVGGWAEYTVHMTETSDTVRHDVVVPPRKVIPVIFLPGVMGSNLRLSKERQKELKRPENRAWRPDDMVSVPAKLAAAGGVGLGGWFKDASPAQRQLMLDPNETEVEYYHYTESNNRFDPEGKETQAADKRHQNVPDTLAPIPPLMGARWPIGRGSSQRFMRKRETPAQIARWRGWSEVFFTGAYGEMLRTAEEHLNNMLLLDKAHPNWQPILKDPKEFGAAETCTPLAEKDLIKVGQCWYPVHAMGYNFLKSNGESARVIADRIRGLTHGYQKRGFKCDEVIVVTHSMGGLLARALIHPKYGNLLNDPAVKVLGIYHNVMPTMGAAATYKRMRFGFLEGAGAIAEIKASIFGIDGKNATAVLANAPAALELLPNSMYGASWLKVVDGCGREIWSLPGANGDALNDIYTRSETAWWRLINPLWATPGSLKKNEGGDINAVGRRLKRAYEFTEDLKTTFHPNTFASFCSSSERRSYGETVFKIADSQVWNVRNTALPPAHEWKPLTDDGKGTLTVSAGGQVLTLTLEPPSAAGDETVPADRSAGLAKGRLFVHGLSKGKSYEHQDSYGDRDVLASLLYSIVQIANTARWEGA
jgi:hypothetical protein